MSLPQKIQEQSEAIRNKRDNELRHTRDKCTKMIINALTHNLTEQKLINEFTPQTGESGTAVVFSHNYLSFRHKAPFEWNLCAMNRNHDIQKIETKTLEHWKPKGINNVQCLGGCNDVLFDTRLPTTPKRDVEYGGALGRGLRKATS